MSSKAQLGDYVKNLKRSIRYKDMEIEQLNSTLQSVNRELYKLKRDAKDNRNWFQKLFKL